MHWYKRDQDSVKLTIKMGESMSLILSRLKPSGYWETSTLGWTDEQSKLTPNKQINSIKKQHQPFRINELLVYECVFCDMRLSFSNQIHLSRTMNSSGLVIKYEEMFQLVRSICWQIECQWLWEWQERFLWLAHLSTHITLQAQYHCLSFTIFLIRLFQLQIGVSVLIYWLLIPFPSYGQHLLVYWPVLLR